MRERQLLFISTILVLIVCSPHRLKGQIQFSDRISINRSSAEIGVGDFDKDGHVDIAICNAEQRWYKGPEFDTYHVLGYSDGGPYAARVADINNDGYDDFITSDGTRTANEVPGELYVYLNPGANGDVTELWQRILVYSGNVRHQNDLRVVDMNGDGRLDIIERTWADERIVIALQTDDISNWNVRAYETTEQNKPEGISAGDVDGDGDMEIVLSGVYWDSEDDWASGSYNEYMIDPIFFDNEEEVKSAVGDIDNDGDNDIYIGSAEGNFVYLAWYENKGFNPDGVSINFEKHLIKDDFGKCHMVELVDIDKDGDLDLCTGRSFGELGALIFYNNNNGASWTEQNYDPTGTLYTGLVRDLDADGDLDVIGPSKFYGKVYYYLNESTITPPGPPASITAMLEEGRIINLAWSDTVQNESSFEVQRFANSTWSTVATLPANSINYQDTDTEIATAYQYRVRAVNISGNSAWITSEVVTTWPQVGAVSFAPGGGSYVDPTLITLSTSTADDKIYYTLDGSIPDTNSLLYTSPILISTSATLKTLATRSTHINSEVYSEDYNIAVDGNFPPDANAGSDLSVVAIDTFLLDGSASQDIDDTDLNYNWIKSSGPPAVILNPNSIMTQVVPERAGNYQFELTVSDEAISDKDTVSVSVTDPSANLIAHWPMDEVTGVQVKNIITQENASINSGVNLVPNEGKVDGAIRLSGSSARCEAPAIDIIGDSMTITLWIKASNLNNVEARLISKANGTNANDHLWMISQNGGSALRFRLNTNNETTTTLISDTDIVTPNQWQYVAATYDGSTMRLYNNAQLIASIAKSGIISTNPSLLVGIGNQPSGAGERPFDGYIDDVKIFNTTLSQSELQSNMLSSCSSIYSTASLDLQEDRSIITKDQILLSNVTLSTDYHLQLQSQEIILSPEITISRGSQLTTNIGLNCQ